MRAKDKLEEGRGSGRTFRALMACGGGNLYIVSSNGMAEHCREMMDRHEVEEARRPEVRVILPFEDGAIQSLRGMSRSFMVDHDWWRTAVHPATRDMNEALLAQSRS